MIYTHTIDPIALALGSLQIRWYGLVYAFSFLLAYFWLRALARQKRIDFSLAQIENLVFAVLLGAVLGGRIGYFLFYQIDALFSSAVFQVWNGGMSFHGGLAGVLIALALLARKWQKPLFELTDLVALPTAVGLAFGRIANFINGELPGRLTDGSWGVIFPDAPDAQPRHPSQLYASAKNFLIAAILLITFRSRPRCGLISFLFLTLYGTFRIIVEQFWREPLDGFIFGMTTGQFWSVPVLAAGIIGLLWLKCRSR